MSQAEWKPRAEFAEIAEAVGVPTDQVMTVRWSNADLTDGLVLWTGRVDDDQPPRDVVIRGAMIRRSADGVLMVASVPRDLGTLGELMPELFGGES